MASSRPSRSALSSSPLYRPQELAFATQYAELKERSLAQGPLLPGTPGLLSLRTGTGYGYWYRRYYAAPGREVEDLVCKDGDDASLQAMRERIAYARWAQEQVRALRRLGYQVADKYAARVLVELHNRGFFDGGLVIVGTLATMAWFNEMGLVAVAARTQDIDLARREKPKLATPRSFIDAVQATRLDFVPVPGMPNDAPSTSVKRQGKEGLRVDLLTPGVTLGRVAPVPDLQWHAQTVPHFDYLLADARPAAMLAGGHCIPLVLPAPERLVWHKLYSSHASSRDRSKAEKDLRQAATLAAALVERDDFDPSPSAAELPAPLLTAARSRLSALRTPMRAHPRALEAMEAALAERKRRVARKSALR